MFFGCGLGWSQVAFINADHRRIPSFQVATNSVRFGEGFFGGFINQRQRKQLVFSKVKLWVLPGRPLFVFLVEVVFPSTVLLRLYILIDCSHDCSKILLVIHYDL